MRLTSQNTRRNGDTKTAIQHAQNTNLKNNVYHYPITILSLSLSTEEQHGTPISIQDSRKRTTNQKDRDWETRYFLDSYFVHVG